MAQQFDKLFSNPSHNNEEAQDEDIEKGSGSAGRLVRGDITDITILSVLRTCPRTSFMTKLSRMPQSGSFKFIRRSLDLCPSETRPNLSHNKPNQDLISLPANAEVDEKALKRKIREMQLESTISLQSPQRNQNHTSFAPITPNNYAKLRDSTVLRHIDINIPEYLLLHCFDSKSKVTPELQARYKSSIPCLS